MELIEPCQAWRTAFVEMANEYMSFGEMRYQLAIDDFDAYLERERLRRSDKPPSGRVPSATHWLVNATTIVGCVRLRFRLTDELLFEGGHVGYDIRPTMRRRGYGTAILKLAIPLLSDKGICRVRVTCDADNIGSATVIRRNGGILDAEVISPESGKLIQQYWIETASRT